ncbi:hypothetical protein AAG906_033278 [Vitis piasezkii]
MPVCRYQGTALFVWSFIRLCTRRKYTLEQATDFAHRHIGKGLEQNIDQNLAIEVNHALELPLQWRMPRLEARWFIDVYEKRQDMNPILLEFAKSDFNMVQATRQEDLRHMPSMDIVGECPQSYHTLVILIDDVYDIYGALDELELFTDAVDSLLFV